MTGRVLSAESFPARVCEPLPHELERRRRIQLSVMTYAYEIADAPIVSDATWDWLAAKIDRWVGTGHPLLDEFFLTEFSPMTGMWIHNHPELAGVSRIHDRYAALMHDVYVPKGWKR